MNVQIKKSAFVVAGVVMVCLLTYGGITVVFGQAGSLPDRVVWKADGMVMIKVSAGPFMMGGSKNENEKPRHKVTLPTYYMDRTEVTWRQYLTFCKQSGYQVPVNLRFGQTFPPSKLEHPVANVTVMDAEAYCKWAGKRLPTEAEWEKACAGPGGRQYPWGNGWSGSACTNRTNSGDRTTPVGSRPACKSQYGIMDLGGNVWEWTADWYKSYPGGPFTFDFTGKKRVVKGGSYFYSIYLLRCADRYNLPPDDFSGHGGFRCVATPGEGFSEKTGGQ